jgi:hypothetical protein
MHQYMNHVRSYFTIDGIEHSCGICDQILFPVGMLLSEICGLVSVGRRLWWEDGSAICSAITQWSESCRTRNHNLMSHLRLPQPGGPGCRIYIPQEQGGPVKVRVTLRLAVSQSVCLGVEPTLWTFGQILLPFQELASGICCPLSAGGALSEERPCLSFVSHSQVICLCVHLLFTFLSFAHLPYTYI